MKHFTIDEFLRSSVAQERGIDNSLGIDSLRNIEALVDNVLDPLREAWGKPVIVNSGYRCKELNKAVGGAPASQHVKGQAADITAGTRYGNRWLFDHIRNHLPFDQLIDERDYSWVHVSFRMDGKNRGQVLHLS